MRVTAAEYQALQRKRQQPVPAAGELLAIFVPGKLVNPLNATAWMWQKRARLAKQWKERTATAVYEARMNLRADLLLTTRAGARAPKRVGFLAQTWNTMDSDGLAASVKPIRDALIQCGVIHSDAPDSGHEFLYAQRIDRIHRGVEVRVAVRTP